jgi:hypothetical protein
LVNEYNDFVKDTLYDKLYDILSLEDDDGDYEDYEDDGDDD